MSDSLAPRIISLHWGYSVGGVGKYGVLVDKAAHRQGLPIEHICIRGKDWQIDEATLSELNPTEIILKSRWDLSWIWKIRSHLKRSCASLIISHGFNGHFVLRLMKILAFHKSKLISSYHGQYHATSTGRKILAPVIDRFTEWHLRHCLSTVTVANHSKQYLLSRGVPGERVTVIHNGIQDVLAAPDARRRLREEWGIRDGQVLIGVASRLDPIKGINHLLLAFARLLDEYPHVRFVIVGSGVSEPLLRQQAMDLKINEHVVFAGFRPDVADCLSAFDVFALPSLSECHSIALLEAMRAGVAIMATDVGGNAESVRDGVEALVVRPADIDDFVLALSRLIESDDLRKQLGSAARDRFLAEFTEEIMLQKTGAWLKQCLNESAMAAANS